MDLLADYFIGQYSERVRESTTTDGTRFFLKLHQHRFDMRELQYALLERAVIMNDSEFIR
jgi:hypothetical protein